MVSYSRLRPAMSRAEPMRWCVVAAGGGGGCGRRRLRRAARARGFRSGRAHGVSLWTKGPCRHGQGGAAFEGGVSTTISAHHPFFFWPATFVFLAGYFRRYLALPLNRFMAVVRPSPTIASTASAAREIRSGNRAASAREKSEST